MFLKLTKPRTNLLREICDRGLVQKLKDSFQAENYGRDFVDVVTRPDRTLTITRRVRSPLLGIYIGSAQKEPFLELETPKERPRLRAPIQLRSKISDPPTLETQGLQGNPSPKPRRERDGRHEITTRGKRLIEGVGGISEICHDHKLTFLTFGWPDRANLTKQEAWDLWPRIQKQVNKEIERRIARVIEKNGVSCPYWKVRVYRFECFKTGYPHTHMVFVGGHETLWNPDNPSGRTWFLTHRDFRDIVENAVNSAVGTEVYQWGYRANCKFVHGNEAALRYLTKYMTKKNTLEGAPPFKGTGWGASKMTRQLVEQLTERKVAIAKEWKPYTFQRLAAELVPGVRWQPVELPGVDGSEESRELIGWSVRGNWDQLEAIETFFFFGIQGVVDVVDEVCRHAVPLIESDQMAGLKSMGFCISNQSASKQLEIQITQDVRGEKLVPEAELVIPPVLFPGSDPDGSYR